MKNKALSFIGFVCLISSVGCVYYERTQSPPPPFKPNYERIAFQRANSSVGTSADPLFANSPTENMFRERNWLVLEKFVAEDDVRTYEYVEMNRSRERVSIHIIKIGIDGNVLFYEKKPYVVNPD